MKETPGLGQICLLGGCLFVERRSRNNILSEISEIEQALKNGLNILLFPEAKSTNGEDVLKFKRSLFQAAVNCQHDTYTLSLNYKEINGEEIKRHNRDKVFWYGDMDFAGHFIELCQQSSIQVDLKGHTAISSLLVDHCSSALRDNAFEIISSEYKKITT
jgi:1-acyl-sn-glycerol-3-phosphate acyltransferase